MAHGKTLTMRAIDTMRRFRLPEYVTRPEESTADNGAGMFTRLAPQPPYVGDKDRSLRGKARRQARKAARR